MKLRIGDRSGLGVSASAVEFIQPPFARALRRAYQQMRVDGMSPAHARSILLTCYEVGVVSGCEQHLGWLERQARELGLDEHLPSSGVNLTVVPS